MRNLWKKGAAFLLAATMAFSLFTPVAVASSKGLSPQSLSVVQEESVSWDMSSKTFVTAYNAVAAKAVKFKSYKAKTTFSQSLADGMRIQVTMSGGKVGGVILRYDSALESAANTALAHDACEALFTVMTGNNAKVVAAVRSKLGLEDKSGFETAKTKRAVYGNVEFRFGQSEGEWIVSAKPYSGNASSGSSSASSGSSSVGSASKSSSAASSAGTANASPLAPTTAGEMSSLYITNTGSKYHLDGCRHLNESQIPIDHGEAVAQGYEPCAWCFD